MYYLHYSTESTNALSHQLFYLQFSTCRLFSSMFRDTISSRSFLYFFRCRHHHRLFYSQWKFQAAALQKWVLPHFLCKLAPFVQILSVDVSIYTLVAVSLDRYHVMLHPLKPKLSTKAAFLIFLVIWFIALASSTPSLLFYNVYFKQDFGYQCLPYTHELQEQHYVNGTTPPYDIHKIYIVYNIYSQYLIPFIIISCAYFRIASHLYFSKPVGQTKHQEVIARNKRKV